MGMPFATPRGALLPHSDFYEVLGGDVRLLRVAQQNRHLLVLEEPHYQVLLEFRGPTAVLAAAQEQERIHPALRPEKRVDAEGQELHGLRIHFHGPSTEIRIICSPRFNFAKPTVTQGLQKANTCAILSPFNMFQPNVSDSNTHEVNF